MASGDTCPAASPQQQLAVLRDGPFPGAALVWQQAAVWLSKAINRGDHLLEAECLLLPGRWLLPALDPAGLLGRVARARQMFESHERLDQLPLCDAVTVRALYDLGREQEAMAWVRRVVDNPRADAVLKARVRTIDALCLGHVGWLDQALDLLNQQVLPPLRAGGPSLALAQAERAVALMHLQAQIRLRHPSAWRGLAALPMPAGQVWSLPDILAGLDRAQAALPPGERLLYIDMNRCVALVMGQDPAAAHQALQALDDTVAQAELQDPPAAAWALVCLVASHWFLGDQGAAERRLGAARRLAEMWGLYGVMRDVCGLAYEIATAQGQAQAALVALQARMRLDARSLRPAGDGLADARPAPAPLQAQAPSHVRRAVAFVDATPGFCPSVADVVAHCGISRRTLETAFKTARGQTLGQYIRQRRLAHAAQRLLHSDGPQRDVALAAGYRSASAFVREFQAQFGMSPTAWVRQHRG